MKHGQRSPESGSDLDRYLDGEIGRADLPEALRLEEDRIAGWLGALEEDVRAPRGLREEVMRRVASTPRPAWRRIADWMLRPRVVRVTPVWGAAAVAASALLVTLWNAGGPADAAPGSASPEGTGTAAAGLPAGTGLPAAATPGAVMTRFVFVAPQVESVHVTGDFLAWDPDGIPLEDLRGTGIWTADVPLPPGIYQYTFIVDGTRWQADPLAMSQVSDGFGQVNSVLIVSPRAEA